MMRTVTAVAAALCLLMPRAQASPEAMAKLLPADGAVKGWPVFAKTLTHSPSADTLYKIYDGGDQVYIDAGVVEAIQQSYRSTANKHIATVTLHRMKSSAKAKAFYESHQKGLKTKKGYKQLTGLKTAGCLYTGAGSSTTYGHHKGYFVVVVIAGNTATDQTAASLLLRDTLKRIK